MAISVGKRGEELAAGFLSGRGFRIVERNFRYDHGEIDLIVQKGKLIVFCEVKTRRTDTYGPGELAVDERKQRQIRKVAGGYIESRSMDDCEFRFDVIVVELKGKTSRIRMIENAF